MTVYAVVKDNTLVKYPYRFAQLQEENPTTNYGDNYDVMYWYPLTESAIQNGYSLVEVNELSEPSYNDTQKLVQQDSPNLVDSVWTVGWNIVDKTSEEIQQELAIKRANMVVSPFQAKAALLQAGLLSQVEALINDPATDPLVVLAWNNASEYRRTSSMIVNLAATLNLTDTQLDELFTNAATIVA